MDYTVRSKVDESGSGGLGVGGAWGGGAPESGIVDQCVMHPRPAYPEEAGGRGNEMMDYTSPPVRGDAYAPREDRMSCIHVYLGADST
ncbi:hypothetical protein V491_06366, partial [Pseudogymnoascus sp. VKM F-3775]